VVERGKEGPESLQVRRHVGRIDRGLQIGDDAGFSDVLPRLQIRVLVGQGNPEVTGAEPAECRDERQKGSTGSRAQIDDPRGSRLPQRIGEKRSHTCVGFENGGVERQEIGQEIPPHGGKPRQLVELYEVFPIHLTTIHR